MQSSWKIKKQFTFLLKSRSMSSKGFKIFKLVPKRRSKNCKLVSVCDMINFSNNTMFTWKNFQSFTFSKSLEYFKLISFQNTSVQNSLSWFRKDTSLEFLNTLILFLWGSWLPSRFRFSDPQNSKCWFSRSNFHFQKVDVGFNFQRKI